MARRLAAAATSRKTPRLEFVDIPTAVAVPVATSLLLANGVPAVGRTRTFCQVSLQVTPLILLLVTVNTNSVVVTEAIATEEPLETPLMLLAAPPLPMSRSILTVGAVPLVSKMKPFDGLRISVPVPAFPLAISE